MTREAPAQVVAAGHVARRDLVALVTAGTLGRAPIVVIPIATLLLVADRSTLTLGGFASGAASLGAGIGGLLLGRRLDGSAARWVLTILAVLHIPAIVLFIAVAGSTNRLVLVGAGLLAGITVPPIGPVVRARLAGLAADAPPAELRRVFAWDSLSVELSWIGAPLLVSLAIVIGGPSLAVAMSPVLAAVGIASITTGSMSAARAEPASVRWVTPAMIRLALAFGIMGVGWRIVTIGVTEIARVEGGDRWTGPVIAMWALGSVIGAWVATRREMPGVLVLGVLVGLTIAALAAGSSSLAATIVIGFVSGLPTAPFVAAANAIITEVVDPAAHARAFSLAQASHTLVAAGGAVAAAWAIDQAGVATVFVPGAIAIALSGWLAASVQPAARRPVAAATA